MGIWDWIKNFFGVQHDDKQGVSEEELEKYRQSESELNAKLDQMDRAYRDRERENYVPMTEILPSESGYTYREYTGDSLQEMLRKAQESYGARYRDKAQQTQQSYDSRRDQLNVQAKEQTDKLRDKLLQNERAYDSAARASDGSLLDRGMGRSSTVQAVRDALARETEQANDEIAQAHGELLERLKDETMRLERERDQALKSLDLEHASQLQQQIERQEREYADEQRKIREYNESVRQKETEYQKKRQESIEKQIRERDEFFRKQAEQEAENGYWGDKAVDYDRRVRLALEYYRSVPKETAMELIARNDALRSYLGHDYGKLIAQIAGA